MDKRWIHKDGGSVYAETSVKAIRKADGSVDYFVALSLDITQRKIAEEALRDSEERFRGAFDQSIIPMVLIGADGEISKVNTAFTRLLGYTAEELRATGWDRLVQPDDLKWCKSKSTRIDDWTDLIL